MRVEFIPSVPADCAKTKNKREQKRRLEAYDWAAKIIRVEGGFMAFESMTDYQTWLRQV